MGACRHELGRYLHVLLHSLWLLTDRLTVLQYGKWDSGKGGGGQSIHL